MAIILGLPTIVVNAYLMIANTAFYELATENLVVMNSADYDNMVNAEYTVKEESAPAETSDPAVAPDEEPVAEEHSEERPE